MRARLAEAEAQQRLVNADAAEGAQLSGLYNGVHRLRVLQQPPQHL